MRKILTTRRVRASSATSIVTVLSRGSTNGRQPDDRRRSKAIRTRCSAATPGPWEIGEDAQEAAATLRVQPIFASTGQLHGDPVDVILPFGRAYSDARFCATARTDVPRLLDEVDRFRAWIKWARTRLLDNGRGETSLIGIANVLAGLERALDGDAVDGKEDPS